MDSPLYKAVSRGHAEEALTLLREGATPDKKTLHFAIRILYLEMVDLLLGYGAHVGEDEINLSTSPQITGVLREAQRERLALVKRAKN